MERALERLERGALAGVEDRVEPERGVEERRAVATDQALGGGAEEPLVAPAGATIVRELEVELNFADSDRRLFDLIARLGSVRYRLRGEALLSAGGGASRTLAARFDVEGSCAVER